MNNVSLILKRRAQLTESALIEYLPREEGLQQIVVSAMRYAVMNGGKRIRPELMMEFYTLFGGIEENILPFACALEMIHSYSLVHDDLPCMDNDDMRRGKPSCHKQFGEWQALLAGDALLTYAFETASTRTDYTVIAPKQACFCIAELAKAAGIYGMVGGQTADLECEGKTVDTTVLEQLHLMKTGALIRVAGKIGAIAADARKDQVEMADGYCRLLGLAFQIKDDILDVEGDPVLLGKPAGSDAKKDKSTYVTCMGLSGAKNELGNLTQQAIVIAKKLGSPFLEGLAEFVASRTT